MPGCKPEAASLESTTLAACGFTRWRHCAPVRQTTWRKWHRPSSQARTPVGVMSGWEGERGQGQGGLPASASRQGVLCTGLGLLGSAAPRQWGEPPWLQLRSRLGVGGGARCWDCGGHGTEDSVLRDASPSWGHSSSREHSTFLTLGRGERGDKGTRMGGGRRGR